MSNGIRIGVYAAMVALVWGCAGEDWSREAHEAAESIRQHRIHIATARQAQADGIEEVYQNRMILANAAVQDAARTLEGMPIHRVRDIAALTVYAEAQALANHPDLVTEALERLDALEPGNHEHAYRLAMILAEMGASRSEEALRAAHRTLRMEDLPDPRRAQVFNAYGRAAHEAGLFDLAAEAYNKALELDEAIPWPRLAAALLLLDEGNVNAAATAIDAFGTVPPDLAPLFTRLLRASLQRFDTSGRHLPDSPAHHMAYARLLVRDGRFGDAMLVLRRAAESDAESIVAWNMLGSVSANMGEAALAREAFERSLAIDPNQPRTLQSLESLDAAGS